MTVEQVIAAARQLSADERANVIAALESTDVATTIGADGWVPDVGADVRDELLRRTAASDADPSRLLSQPAFDARMAALLASRR